MEPGAVGDLAKAVNYSANHERTAKRTQLSAMRWFNPGTAHQFLRILGGMGISGAFLAEKVEAVNNKLNVKGGVISNFKVGRDE